MGRGSARAQALCERRARSRGGCDSARTSVSSSGPSSEDVHDAHIEGGVAAIGAGEHVHRRAVPRGEAAAEHVRHLGVLRRAGLVGAHRLDHHALDDLRVRLGRHQTLVHRRQPTVTTRRVRVRGRSAGREKRRGSVMPHERTMP